MPRKIAFTLAVTAILLGIVVYYTFDPSEGTWFPKCPFYWASGYKCPGCGSQRALHHLLHFHLKEAVRYNALLVFSIPLLLFLIVADIRKNRWPAVYRLSRNPVLSWGILAAILLWWLLRNVFNV